jgi:thiol:disulfide interchange protein
VVGTLLMAVTFTLTSFTCTAPFIGTLLVMASQGKWTWPLAGMLAYSTAFSIPFFLLALLPQYVSQLPRSGGWLNSVKVLMGFLEVAAAMKFLSNADLIWNWQIFTRQVVLAVWVAIGILVVVYLLGKFQMPHDTPIVALSAGRVVLATVFLSGAVWLTTGLFGKPLGELEPFLPPAEAKASSASATQPQELSWILNDYPSALKQSKQTNQPIFIDFTGYTCTNCRWMEANMFPRPEIKEQLEKFVRVRLFTDREGHPYEDQQKMEKDRFDTVALPLYAIVSPIDQTVATFPGLTRKPEEFLQFLKK